MVTATAAPLAITCRSMASPCEGLCVPRSYHGPGLNFCRRILIFLPSCEVTIQALHQRAAAASQPLSQLPLRQALDAPSMPTTRTGRFRVALSGMLEFTVGRCFVRVYAGTTDLPGVNGWVGAWAVYLDHPSQGGSPVRVGSTDIEQTEALALGMAKAIASQLAATL